MRFPVTLQHGCHVDGLELRHAWLREINGHDEQRLASIRNVLPPFLQSAELAKRTATFEGLPEDRRHDAVRNLSVGDRVLLMLHLRRATLGDAIRCTLDCPGCKEKMSLDLSVSTLLKSAKMHEGSFQMTVGEFALQVRPATLSNQQELSGASNPVQALARSCITSSMPPLPSGPLSEKVMAAVSQKLQEVDPLADIVLDIACPSCGASFQTPFDVEAFFLEEISLRSRQLEQEVHWLAFHYHWSEESILSLTASKRRRYIELINETLSRATT